MGLFGLFKKEKELDIPPPPPPIIASETVPLPLKEQKPVEFAPPKISTPEHLTFFRPPIPKQHLERAIEARNRPEINIDDFMPRNREQIFADELPQIPGFSEPMHVPPELGQLSPEDFGSTILEGELSMQEIHRPEPIVPPLKPKVFKHINSDLRRIEEQQIGKPLERKPFDKPLFVKADDYKSILGALTVIRSKIGDSEKILADLNELKNVKDKSFEKWRTELEDIQRKLLYIDKTLYEHR
jgi:hypothetical protein